MEIAKIFHHSPTWHYRSMFFKFPPFFTLISYLNLITFDGFLLLLLYFVLMSLCPHDTYIHIYFNKTLYKKEKRTLKGREKRSFEDNLQQMSLCIHLFREIWKILILLKAEQRNSWNVIEFEIHERKTFFIYENNNKKVKPSYYNV